MGSRKLLLCFLYSLFSVVELLLGVVHLCLILHNDCFSHMSIRSIFLGCFELAFCIGIFSGCIGNVLLSVGDVLGCIINVSLCRINRRLCGILSSLCV